MRPSPLRLMDHREFPLLYVDDEVDNLRIFELTFRRDFTILTATSAQQGLEILNENPVAVVLSDQRMPGMSGVEFLSRVRALDPKTLRILMTAYGDVETLGIAINDGSIYRYIPKPWEPDDLRLTLCRAIETYALDRERDALVRELTQLNQLSRDLHSELDLKKLIQTLIQATHRDLGFDGAAFLLFDGSHERLDWAGVAPENDAVAEHIQRLEITRDSAPEFINEIQLGSTQALRAEGLEDLPKVLREWLIEVSADEILAVPLIGKEELIGVLAVDNRSGGRRFGADDQTLLDGIATQAVVAIENAKIVDDLRSARHQVQRADRLGTLGTLAAGLAHEINNPLVSVQTFVEMAPSKKADHDDDFWKTYHALACTELERIRDLVLTMSRLAHGGDVGVAPGEVCLESLAREVKILLQAEAQDAEVELEVQCVSGTPGVWGVRPQLQQVLLNLICNAIQATPPDGRVDVRIYSGADSPIECVCVEVEDSGQGIADENLERIFDPFFTTKDPDQGTGLGLMITHQIVQDHGGSIEVRSSPGEGSNFCLRLPIKAGQTLDRGSA
jgi:signal transduction histidine kinase